MYPVVIQKQALPDARYQLQLARLPVAIDVERLTRLYTTQHTYQPFLALFSCRDPARYLFLALSCRGQILHPPLQSLGLCSTRLLQSLAHPRPSSLYAEARRFSPAPAHRHDCDAQRRDFRRHRFAERVFRSFCFPHFRSDLFSFSDGSLPFQLVCHSPFSPAQTRTSGTTDFSTAPLSRGSRRQRPPCAH